MKKIFTLLTLAIAISFSSFAQLATFNVSTLPGGTNNFGPNPLPPTTTDANATVVGFTRASGVSTTGAGAVRGWGGVNWSADAAAGVAANAFFTFSVTANTGFTESFSSINPFSYRRSGTGATNALIQYQLGAGAFTDITTVAFPTTAATGATLGSIDLSAVGALQAVASGVTVTFRIIPYGATGAGGTFYIFDVANSTASDFSINGTTTPSVVAFSSAGDISAVKSSNKTNLTWNLGCNADRCTYELQRSANGVTFNALKTETVTPAQCAAPFSFTDAQPLSGVNYYRVKVTDLDGTSSYSKVVSVRFNGTESIKVVPTIAVNDVKVYYESAVTGNSTWVVYDMTGRVVSKSNVNLLKGQNTITINVSSLLKGQYQIVGNTESGKTDAVKIIKQ
jgi:hypothetical protein